ncbi:MAG: pentapeptide repeat-containing protein [Candidatus Contendobacter sp.]|nr:pentapeptide repeat-containing protein [Candidatus Contendobacter sp.]
MIETARALLEILGGWRCEEATDIPGMLASKEDFLAGDARLRVLFVEDTAASSIAHWAQQEPATDLLLLGKTTDEVERAKRLLADQADMLKRNANANTMSWAQFVSGLVKLPGIQDHYHRLKSEYLQTEGENFRYIDPLVVDDTAQRTAKLFAWAEQHEAASRGGLVFLAAEYGEGKTSFCFNYAFRWLERAELAGGIPLLFLLNECDAAGLEQFLIRRLHEDYGLNLSFAEFVRLCRLGVFIPVLDALDQMGHGAGGMRIERDRATLRALAGGRAPVYCTCRLGFFNQHLKTAVERESESSSWLLLIRGFSAAEVAERLQEFGDLFAFLDAPGHRDILGGIHYKPLILQIIVNHEASFRQLVTSRLSSVPKAGGSRPAPLTEYDLFELLFTGWRARDHAGLSAEQSIQLLRAITARARLDGTNVAIPFASLATDRDCAGILSDPARSKAALDCLKQLPLLDQAKLRRNTPSLVFRFNAYLEFLVAFFVLDELKNPNSPGERAFVKVAPLTWESRRMVAARLRAEEHGESLRRLVDATRFRHFRDVDFQGGNALTLILDRIQHGADSTEERQSWLGLLRELRLKHAVLRGLDARGADLSGLDFSRCDLEDADLSFATLRNTSLAQAHLAGVRIQEAGALLTTAFIRREGAGTGHWRLAGGTENGMLTLWGSDSPFPSRSRPHTEAVTAVEMRGSGNDTLYSASLDGALCASAIGDLHSVRSFPLAMGSLRAMAGEDDTLVVAGDRDYVELIRATDGVELRRIKLERARGALVTCIALTSEQLFVGNRDGDIYRCADWREAGVFDHWGENLGGPIRSLVVLTEQELLALLDNGQIVHLDRTGAERSIGWVTGSVQALGYARSSNRLFFLQGQRLLEQEWRAGQPHPFGHLPHPESKAVLACSPDGQFVAVGGERLTVWGQSSTGVELLLDEPMRMDCAGLILDRAVGLDENTRAFLEERGAL